MLYNRRSGLYMPRPTLEELYADSPTLFNGLQLPTSIPLADFQLEALTQLGSLDTIFSSASLMAAYLPVWSAHRLPGWNRLQAALEAEYDPISNYNMREVEIPAQTTDTIRPAETTETETPAETTETRTPAETTVTTNPAETTQTRTPAETTETETPAETTVTRTPAEVTDTNRPAETTVTDRPPEVTDTGNEQTGIFGFNSSEASPSDSANSSTARTVQTAGTGVTTVQTAGSNVHTVQTPETDQTTTNAPGSRALSVGSPETVKTETNMPGTEVLTVIQPETVKRETDTAGSRRQTTQTPETRVFTVQENRVLTREGNVGVTTNQQMLEAEVQLRQRYRLMQIILDDFRADLCVGVW